MTIRPKWDQMNFNGKSIMGIWNLDLAWKNTLQHYPCVDWWKTQDTVGQMIISLRNKSHISSSCVLWDQCQRPLDVPVMSFWWTCSMLVTSVVRVLLLILRKGVMSWIISLSDRYLRVNLCEFSFCARCPGLCICICEASWVGWFWCTGCMRVPWENWAEKGGASSGQMILKSRSSLCTLQALTKQHMSRTQQCCSTFSDASTLT